MQSLMERQVRGIQIPQHILDKSCLVDSSSRFRPLAHSEVLDHIDSALERAG